MHDRRCFLGIDIGASAIKYGWGSRQIGMEHFGSVATPCSGIEAISEALAVIIEGCQKDIGKLSGIGIGIPGTLETRTGILKGINPNLRFLSGARVNEIIPKRLTIPFWFENDANLMTFSEASQYPQARVVIGLTLGSGIGSGAVIDGSIYRGGCGFAMEAGHIPVIGNALECNCGRRGCLEAYSSMTGMRKRLQSMGIDAGNWDYNDILRVSKHNQDVNLVVNDGLEHLITGIEILALLFDPDVIVLGGGMTEAQDFPWQTIEDGAMSLIPEQNGNHLKLVKAAMGNRSGVWGGIILAESKHPQ